MSYDEEILDHLEYGIKHGHINIKYRNSYIEIAHSGRDCSITFHRNVEFAYLNFYRIDNNTMRYYKLHTMTSIDINHNRKIKEIVDDIVKLIKL